MIERTKKGFSLVEVMLLFTVLAVFMAASMPVMTKKIKAVPKKAAHGVYRCVYDSSANGGRGALREYLYSSNKAIKNGVIVNSCSFNVPTAAMYKVDLYSAGAGGTRYGRLISRRNDDRYADRNMTGMNTTSYRGTGTDVAPLREPEDKELVMFDGMELIHSILTGDAGNGGTGKVSDYFSAVGSQCEAYDMLYPTIDKKYAEYTKKCQNIDSIVKAENEKIAFHRQLCESAESYTGNIDTICNRFSSCSNLFLQTYVYRTCMACKYYKKSIEDCDKEAEYEEYKTKCNKNCKTSYTDQAKATACGKAMGECMSSTHGNYNYCNPILQKCLEDAKVEETDEKCEKEKKNACEKYKSYSSFIRTSTCSSKNSNKTKAAEAAETCATSKYGTAQRDYNNENMRNGTGRGSCYGNPTTTIKYQATDKNYSSYENNYHKYHCTGFTDAPSYASTFSKNKVNGLGYINGSTYLYPESIDGYKWIHNEADLQKQAKAVYGDDSQMFDADRTYSGGNPVGYVENQFRIFCELQYPAMSNKSKYTMVKSSRTGTGGTGGKGMYMVLTTPIRYVPQAAATRDQYLKDLVSKGPKGFYPVICTDSTLTNCSPGTVVQDAGNGNSRYPSFANASQRQNISSSAGGAEQFVAYGTNAEAQKIYSNKIICKGSGKYLKNSHCVCDMPKYECQNGTVVATEKRDETYYDTDNRDCSVIEKEKKASLQANCGTDCPATCPEGMTCIMQGNTPTCACRQKGYGTNASPLTDGKCGPCGNGNGAHVAILDQAKGIGAACVCSDPSNNYYDPTTKSCKPKNSGEDCPTKNGKTATYNIYKKACVCNDSNYEYKKTLQMCLPPCPSYFTQYPGGKCIYTAPLNPSHCAGSHTGDGRSYCYDSSVGAKYKIFSSSYNPYVGFQAPWHSLWYEQRVSNPQQYFKGEEYNNLFTFKNTMNMLGEDFDLQNLHLQSNDTNGMLLASMQAQDAERCDSYEEGCHSGGGGGGNSFNCNTLPQCRLDIDYPYIKHCQVPRLRDSRCPGSWQCQKCEYGYERVDEGCRCYKTNNCPPTKDEFDLVGTTCVCPSGTYYHGKKPMNNMCNQITCTIVSEDGYKLVRNERNECQCPTGTVQGNKGELPDITKSKTGAGYCNGSTQPDCNGKRCYGMTKLDSLTCECVCQDSTKDKLSESVCTPKCPPGMYHGPNASATNNDCKCINGGTYGPNGCVTSQTIYTGGTVTIQTNTTNGQDVKQYGAFHIPNIMYTSGSKDSIQTAITSQATGGTRGWVDVTYNMTTSMNPSPFSLITYTAPTMGSTISGKYSFTATKTDGTSGHDVQISSKRIQGLVTYADITARSKGSGAITQEPRMKLESHLWSKQISIGQAGTPGTHQHFVAVNLGTNCTFRVPAGGPVYDLMNKNVTQNVQKMQDDLAVIMTCRKDNQVVFDKRIEGGKYNTQPTPLQQIWWQHNDWNKVLTYSSDAPREHKTWAPTSIWAKVFNFMRRNGAYDLAAMGISDAGQGTTLSDRCTVPRGSFKMYMVNVLNGQETGRYKENSINDAKGLYNGAQCYPNDTDDYGERLLYDDEPAVRSGGYQLNATPGGAGAVVITW